MAGNDPSIHVSHFSDRVDYITDMLERQRIDRTSPDF